MTAPLDGAIVVVTGASSGIGLELAKQLAPRVRALALVARRTDRLEELATSLRAKHASLKVLVRPCDLTDLADAGAMIDDVERELGPVDVLVNNAGFGDVGAFDLADWDKLARMIQLNIVSLTYLTKRVIAGMYERRRGGILNISSGFGLEFMPSFATYCATKHYVTAFTESLRLEARQFGVTVTQVCPGPVDTEFEAVAGNPTGESVPSFIRISASHCARSSLRGFARGRAIVRPGLALKIMLFFGATSARWIKRLFYIPAAKWLRQREVRAKLTKG